MVVVPVCIASSAPIVTINVLSSGESRLAGRIGEARGIREPEVLVEAALEGRRKVRVAVDQPRQQRLPMSVVDFRTRIFRKEVVRGANLRNPIAVHSEPDVVVHCVDRHNGGMSEHDGRPGRNLGAERTGIEQESGGGGARSGEQLAPADRST